MKLIFKILAFAFLFLPSLALTADDDLPAVPKGPLVLTSVTREQLKPGYWINRLPDANKVLKTPQEIQVMNQDTYSMVRDQVDIFKMAQKKDGASVREAIERAYNALSGRGLFDLQDAVIPRDFFKTGIKPLLQVEKIPSQIKIRWGAAVRAASVRALPSDVKMLEKKQDVEFDQLQFTQIKPWTPVAIYHSSTDGEWFYIQAPYTRGWIKARDIAIFPSRDELAKYVNSKSFLAVTGESIPVYADGAFENPLERASMGTVLPLVKKTENSYVVSFPMRNEDGSASVEKAYVKLTSDVSRGFKPYTQANIIRQAFKLLGTRYGWGGAYNGRDCSGFIQDVYLSLGVNMPRSSKGQGFVGTQLGHYEYGQDDDLKKQMLDAAVPGTTILRMPKHMMIYLGKVGDQYYAIHSTWAERNSMTNDDKIRINQVVVSDLTLNGRSYLGSLFHRLISANEVN